jgi:hypothetical protein
MVEESLGVGEEGKEREAGGRERTGVDLANLDARRDGLGSDDDDDDDDDEVSLVWRG